MGKVRALLAFCAILVAPAGWADGIRVKSGEHEGFSRLVVEFRDLPDWRFGRTENGYALVTKPGGWNYDLGEVFRFIPRSRIREVIVGKDGERLSIILGCDCHARAFVVRDTAIVLDVLDAPSDETAAFDGFLDAPSANTEKNRPAPFVDWFETDTASLFTGVRLVAGLPDSRPEIAETNSPRVREPIQPKARDVASVTPEARISLFRDGTLPRNVPPMPVPIAAESETDRSRPDVIPPEAAARSDANRDAVASLLASEVARAATRGFLEANVESEPTPVPSADAPLGNISVRESDRSGRTEPATDPQAASLLASCIADSELDVAAWGPNDSMAPMSLAEPRANLFGEFDQPDRTSSERLARFYIGSGFGAEAAAVLAAIGEDRRSTRLLSALSAIVDEMPEEVPELFRDQIHCPGRSALWAALGGADPGPVPSAAESASVLAAMDELPLPLRRHLGSRLVQFFLSQGDMPAADAARRLIGRAPGPHGESYDLVAARLDAETRDDEGALDALRAESTGPSDYAPEALVALLEEMRERREVAEDRLLETAMVRAYEIRGADTADRLNGEIVRAFVLKGDYSKALEYLRDTRDRDALSHDAMMGLADEFVLSLAEHAPDDVFFNHVFSAQQSAGLERWHDQTALRVAERFLELGFPALARRHLDSAGEDPSVPAIFEARLSLAEEDPRSAIEVLATDDAPEASILRAEAFVRLDQHAEAADAYSALGDTDRSLHLSWRGGNLERLASAGVGARSAIASLVLDVRGTNDTGTGAVNEPADDLPRLLAEARDARSVIEALLAETPRP